jgi:hypothetical protein
MRSNKKLNRRERLQQVLSSGGLPAWLPDQEVFVFFQEDDKQKYLTKGRDGKDVYLNQAAFDQLEVDIKPTGQQILLVKTERMEVLQKIVDEGRAMEAEKLASVTIEPYSMHDAPEPEPVKPEPTTTLFNQPTEVDFYIQRRAQAKRKTHF